MYNHNLTFSTTIDKPTSVETLRNHEVTHKEYQNWRHGSYKWQYLANPLVIETSDKIKTGLSPSSPKVAHLDAALSAKATEEY